MDGDRLTQNGNIYFCMLRGEYRVAEIDIHGWYGFVNINLVPVCACKNNGRNMTSQYQCVALSWHRRSNNVTCTGLKSPSLAVMVKCDRWMIVSNWFLCSEYRKRARNKIQLAIRQRFLPVTASFVQTVGEISHSRPMVAIHRKPYISLYFYSEILSVRQRLL